MIKQETEIRHFIVCDVCGYKIAFTPPQKAENHVFVIKQISETHLCGKECLTKYLDIHYKIKFLEKGDF